MDNFSAPYARVLVRLSELGLLDAVRQGETSATLDYRYLEPGSREWSKFFELDPQPVYSEASGYGDGPPTVVGAELVIGREILVEIVNRAPTNVDDFGFDTTPPVWTGPELLVSYGGTDTAGVFDRYLPLDELLTIESTRREAALGSDSAESREFAALVAAWREWTTSVGLQSAHDVLDAANSVMNDLPATEADVRSEVEAARDRLQAVVDEITVAVEMTDELRGQLMSLIPKTWPTIDEGRRVAGASSARKKELAEATAWVADNGSLRLRKALQAGLLHTSLGAYRDERLAKERPGWSWRRQGEEFKNAINPSEEALDALLKAKTVDQRASLMFRPESQEPVVVCWFLGRGIYLPVSAPEEPF